MTEGQGPATGTRWSSDWWGANGGASGPQIVHDLMDGSWHVLLGSIEGEALLWRGDVSVAGALGAMQLAGSASAAIGVQGSASGEVSSEGINVEAGVIVSIVAAAAGTATWGSLSGTTSVTAGSMANGKAQLGRSGLKAEGEAMLGAQIGVSAALEAGGIGAEATAEGWVGWGVSGKAEASWEGAKLRIGAHGGLAVFLGGQAGGSVTIDPAEVIGTAEDLAEGIGDAAGTTAGTVQDATASVVDGMGDAARGALGRMFR